MRWYLSAAAVRSYLQLAGLEDDDGGPQWAQAERELAAHCDAAHLVREEPARQRQDWRTGRVQVGGRPQRLDLIVSTARRPEGPLPQLISVRAKGARNTRTDGTPRTITPRRP